MTISTTDNRKEYAGDGITTNFAFPYYFLANADLKVLLVTVATGAIQTLVLTTDYTISGAGNPAGGTVTTVATYSSAYQLVIYRDPAITQTVDSVNGDSMDVDVQVETPDDKLTMVGQRLRELYARALSLQDGDTGFVAGNMQIPVKVDRASKYLAFDANGLPVAATAPSGLASAFMATVLGDTTAAAARTTLGVGATDLPALITDVRSETGAQAFTQHEQNIQFVSVFQFMTQAQRDDVRAGTAAVDVTAAIQAAINAFSSGYVDIHFPQGIYLVTSTITVAKDNVRLLGQGAIIKFAPTAAGAAIVFDKGSAVMSNVAIKGFRFRSADTIYVKTAINMVDCSAYEVEDITVETSWTGTPAPCIGIQINGRELGWYRNLRLFTDRPLVIGPIPSPHTAGGIDHHNFHNVYFIGLSAHPLIEILDNTPLTQVSFTGTQAWVGGTYGLYWADTSLASASSDLVLQGIRMEQTTDGTKYSVYISHNHELQGLKIIGGQFGDRQGFYLRKVSNVVFDTLYYTNGSGEALNANSTVKRIEGRNCFWQAGSTKTLSGQTLVSAMPMNPSVGALPPTFYYNESVGTTYSRGEWKDFAPTVTLVGGTGNIVPVYNGNAGRFKVVDGVCYVEISLTGDGGNEGAGTGQVNIALPVNASSSCAQALRPAGHYANGATADILSVQILLSASTALIYKTSGFAVFTGADQNNISRYVALAFVYEVGGIS
jgi:Pectate lyase superfamily protein